MNRVKKNYCNAFNWKIQFFSFWAFCRNISNSIHNPIPKPGFFQISLGLNLCCPYSRHLWKGPKLTGFLLGLHKFFLLIFRFHWRVRIKYWSFWIGGVRSTFVLKRKNENSFGLVQYDTFCSTTSIGIEERVSGWDSGEAFIFWDSEIGMSWTFFKGF